jgi:hypothetical protein
MKRQRVLLAVLATSILAAGATLTWGNAGRALFSNAATGHAYPSDLGSTSTSIATGYVLTIKTLSPLDAQWAPGGPPVVAGRLLGVFILTTTATATSTALVYTPVTGTTREEIEYLGGGGGSAFCIDAASTGEALGGGAAGENAFLTNTGSPVAAWYYYCGHGGSAGTSTSTTLTGGDTVVQIVSSGVFVAKGGAGSSLWAPSYANINAGGSGVSHYTGGAPDWAFPGMSGLPGISLSAALGVASGAGGNSRYGSGGAAIVIRGTGATAGNPATGFAAGAGGCVFANYAGHTANGAAGSQGVIIVRDYL